MKTKQAWIGAWAAHTALVVAGALAGTVLFPRAPDWAAAHYAPQALAAPAWARPFLNWDAHWYTRIAAEGYTPESLVFFPLMPMLARGLAWLTGLPVPVAGLAISNALAFICFGLLQKLGERYLTPSQARQAVWALALAPTGFYLNCFYTESLFLACCLATALAASRGQVLAAGVAAALATLTRNTGLGLELLVLASAWPQLRLREGWLKALIALVLPVLALGGYMAFQYHLSGDALAFITRQQAFHRHFALPGQGAVDTLKLLAAQGWRPTRYNLYLYVNLAACILAILLLLRLGAWAFQRAERVPLFVLAGAFLLVPLVSEVDIDPLMSLSRYVLGAFPLLLAVGLLQRRLFWPLAALSAGALVLLTALFAQGWWIA